MLRDGSPAPSILLIDVDSCRRNKVAHTLKSSRFLVTVKNTPDSGEREWRQNRYAAALIGLAPSEPDGIGVLNRLRAAGDGTPVIVISGNNSRAEKLRCFEAGSDDFYAEPVDMEELVARLRILLHRHRNDASISSKVGGTVIHYESREIEINGTRIPLTEREFAVAVCLFEARGGTVKRSDIEQRLFGPDQVIASNALDVHVHNLRKKLGPCSILTSRGSGHRMAPALVMQ